jgi:hypothetical protein
LQGVFSLDLSRLVVVVVVVVVVYWFQVGFCLFFQIHISKAYSFSKGHYLL